MSPVRGGRHDYASICLPLPSGSAGVAAAAAAAAAAAVAVGLALDQEDWNETPADGRKRAYRRFLPLPNTAANVVPTMCVLAFVCHLSHPRAEAALRKPSAPHSL